MTIPAYSLKQIAKLKPCPERLEFARSLKLRGKITAKKAIEAGATFDDIVWVAYAIAQTDKDVERRLRLWLADAAAHVLHIFEKERPIDSRPREAIIAARQFARGEIAAAAWAAAWDAAWAAAWDAAGEAARDAAWAAARGAAGAAAGAAARDAAGGGAAGEAARGAAWDAERQWQFERLVYWLSEESQTDWPLPEKQQERTAA